MEELNQNYFFINYYTFYLSFKASNKVFEKIVLVQKFRMVKNSVFCKVKKKMGSTIKSDFPNSSGERGFNPFALCC